MFKRLVIILSFYMGFMINYAYIPAADPVTEVMYFSSKT